MPYFGMNPGIGQPSLRYIPVDTKLSAADTNTTDKLIVAQAPLMYARDGSGGYGTRVALCADGDTPELVAMQRQEHPDAPVSCADLPKGDGITGGFQLDLPYTGAVPTGKELSVKAAGTQVWKIVAAAQALLNTGLVGSNNAITWTAKRAGMGGNSVVITLTNPGGTNPLTVTVVGNSVNVQLATNAGAITSTAAQVIAAIKANSAANGLVDVANTGASTGAGVMAAVSATALSGGEQGGSGRVIGTPANGKVTVQF
jgi:hypothetical protein